MKTRLADINLSPDVFSAVMATGILSIAARTHHYFRISETLGVMASLGLLILVVLMAVTAAIKRRDRDVGFDRSRRHTAIVRLRCRLRGT